MTATKDVSASITDIQSETKRSMAITGDVAQAVEQGEVMQQGGKA